MNFKDIATSIIEKAGMKAVSLEDFKKLEELNDTKLISETTTDGNVITQEAEAWTTGEAIFVEVDGESIPLPIGVYETPTAKLTVEEEGVLASIEVMAEAEGEDPAEDPKEELNYITREQLEEFKMEMLEAVTELLKMGEEVEEKKEDKKEDKKELEKLSVKKQKKQANKLTKKEINKLPTASRIWAMKNN